DYSIAYVYPGSEHRFAWHDYFTIPVESYKYFPFILLFTSDITSIKSETISNLVKDDWTYNPYFYFQQDVRLNLYNIKHTTNPDPKPLPHSSHLCFNRFLRYYNLPTLPELQTIILFLKHLSLFGYNLENSHFNTLIISIKKDYFEAHIYLPFEPKPLPNHFVPLRENLKYYQNITLKSNSHIIFNTLTDLFLATPPSISESLTAELQLLYHNQQHHQLLQIYSHHQIYLYQLNYHYLNYQTQALIL
ncbi:2988_t:CDS:1, partial [Ambispora leptoticha]